MKSFLMLLALALALLGGTAQTCYLSSQEIKGNYKICYYGCGAVITISPVSLCPLYIDR